MPAIKLFEAIFRNATIGILVTDEKGQIVLANDFSLKEFGYDETELAGKSIEMLIPKRYHKQHTNERNVYQSHPETRAMGAGRDLFGLRKDGSEFPVEVSLAPFQASQGKYVISFIINITVRKEKESSEKIYQQKVEEIMDSLKKEKELNDLKSKFVSLASHEFKTPLSTILSSATLLSKYTPGTEQVNRDKHIERIKSAVKNLNGILNEFLSVSKIENGKIQVHYLHFDIKVFVKNICLELQDTLKKDQRFQYEHEGDTSVFLDVELLRTILVNILSNAIKFSVSGKIIQIRTRCTSEQTELNVKDQGCGIAAEDQAHLFERFFRGNNVLTIPGTGLGLNIVQKYVALMDGEILVNSVLSYGTEVCINFKR